MKQHYLPQCYLREFCNRQDKLHTLDLDLLKYKRKVFDEQKSTAEVCRDHDMYTIKPEFKEKFKHLSDLNPLYLEKEFHEYERKYPAIIQKIKNKQVALINQDAQLLIYALVDIKIRNPYFKKSAIEGNVATTTDRLFEDYMEQVKNLEIPEDYPIGIKEETLKKMAELKEEYKSDKDFAQKTHISSLVKRKQDPKGGIIQKIIDNLLKFEWTVFEKRNAFITTDNPGVSYDENNRVQNTKFDTNFMFFMPLTHSLCLGITPYIVDRAFPKNQAQKRINYIPAEPYYVNFINALHGFHVSKYIFANNSTLINEVATLINTKAGLN